MKNRALTSVEEFILKQYGGDIAYFAQLYKTSVCKVNEWILHDAHIINGKICIPTKHSA